MKLEIKLDRNKVQTNTETSLLMLVKVIGEEKPHTDEAIPMNLSLVIDRSGSMQGDKLAYVKQAARELVRRLGPEDTISVVAYDNEIDVPHYPSRITDPDLILSAINHLDARGTTNLSGGWEKGCELVKEYASAGKVNRVLLLSDGLANEGITDVHRLRNMACEWREKGITTTTMGVGMGFNEDLMRVMAVEGGGAFYFIDHPDQAPELFHVELSDLQHVIGQDLTISLETGSSVRAIKQLNDYTLTHHSGSTIYNLGEVFSGETRSQVFELTLAPLSSGKALLGRVEMNCVSVIDKTGEPISLSAEISVKACTKSRLKGDQPDEEVVRAALFQKAARARDKAVSLADERNFKEAARVLYAAAEEIRNSGIENSLLLAEYARLKEEAARMDFGEQTFDSHMRKMHQTKSHHSRRAEHYAVQSSAMHARYIDQYASIERRGPNPSHVLVQGKPVKFSHGSITIGSDPDSDLVLSSPMVGGKHCRMTITAEKWMLIPGEEKYRVHANGGRVKDPFRLSAGDVVRVGDVMLEFE